MNKNSKLVIINYGMSNIRSVHNKFKRLGVNCIVTNKREDIEIADKLILPGVGHFKKGMENLEDLGLLEILNKKVLKEKTPILGICLGVQLFAKHSEEGNYKGLGWIDANVVKFCVSDKLKYKIPHMGWNDVNIRKNILNFLVNQDDQFYFIHSYYLKCTDPQDVWMTTKYEVEFVSAINHGNIYGTQFHPEKSHDTGFELLKKFAEI